MTRGQIIEARQALLTQLPVTGEILRGSLFERTVRHTSGCTICAGGGGHPLWVLTISYAGGRQSCAVPAGSQSWVLPRASRRGAIRPQQRVVEFADVLERFLELVVIAEPPAHVINLFAAQAELASTAAGIADG